MAGRRCTQRFSPRLSPSGHRLVPGSGRAWSTRTAARSMATARTLTPWLRRAGLVPHLEGDRQGQHHRHAGGHEAARLQGQGSGALEAYRELQHERLPCDGYSRVGILLAFMLSPAAVVQADRGPFAFCFAYVAAANEYRSRPSSWSAHFTRRPRPLLLQLGRALGATPGCHQLLCFEAPGWLPVLTNGSPGAPAPQGKGMRRASSTSSTCASTKVAFEHHRVTPTPTTASTSRLASTRTR